MVSPPNPVQVVGGFPNRITPQTVPKSFPKAFPQPEFGHVQPNLSPMDQNSKQRAHFTDSMRLVMSEYYKSHSVGEVGYKRFPKSAVLKLSRELGLTKVQVKQWCRNRNKRERANLDLKNRSLDTPSFINVHSEDNTTAPEPSLSNRDKNNDSQTTEQPTDIFKTEPQDEDENQNPAVFVLSGL